MRFRIGFVDDQNLADMLNRCGIQLRADGRQDFCALRAFRHDADLDQFVDFQGLRDFLQHRLGQARIAYHDRRT